MQFLSTIGFAATADDQDGMLVASLCGDLDLHASRRLQGFLRSLEPLPDLVALDCSRLRFIDAGGLRLLLAEQERALAADRRLVCIGVHGVVLSTMRLVALDEVLPIAPALD
jgi:anti-anti-sigma factor